MELDMTMRRWKPARLAKCYSFRCWPGFKSSSKTWIVSEGAPAEVAEVVVFCCNRGLFGLNIYVNFGILLSRMSRQANLTWLAIRISGDVKNFILLIRTRGSKNSLLWWKLLEPSPELVPVPVSVSLRSYDYAVLPFKDECWLLFAVSLDSIWV